MKTKTVTEQILKKHKDAFIGQIIVGFALLDSSPFDKDYKILQSDINVFTESCSTLIVSETCKEMGISLSDKQKKEIEQTIEKDVKKIIEGICKDLPRAIRQVYIEQGLDKNLNIANAIDKHTKDFQNQKLKELTKNEIFNGIIFKTNLYKNRNNFGLLTKIILKIADLIGITTTLSSEKLRMTVNKTQKEIIGKHSEKLLNSTEMKELDKDKGLKR